MQINMIKLFLILILASSLAGCAALQGAGSSEKDEEAYAPGSLAVTAKLRFHDVPVPAGFKLEQDKSFIFQAEGTRVALMKYAGRAKTQELINFYKEQMALYNWNLLNVVEYGRSVLNFEREEQSCIVTIESRAMRKLVTISVAPKGSGHLEAELQKD
ncbi:MAG: hypothetical protein JSV30_02195 [Candidatus Omnitrophota bacterium]|nr:MAG: hypothetical protein JSV30_02195 [Candidatus Omnitrophota bacterium]